MVWADYAILVIVALSIAVGIWRGFVREVFSLAVWAAAIWLAFQFSGVAAQWLPTSISLPSARTAIAFVGIFVAVLLLGALGSFLLSKLVESTGLSGTDRLLGSIFGAIRGVVLVLLLILVTGFTPLPQDPWWQESQGISALLPLADWMVSLLPESVGELIDFRPVAGSVPA